MTTNTENIEHAAELVTATIRGVRYVLLIERGDGWAMPSGAVEPGERPAMAAARELWKETGLILPWNRFALDEPCWAPERNVVTVVARCDLGEADALPEVRGGDDARSAGWWPIADAAWATKFHDVIFPAHREILAALR
jgi:ADP-ribose pyrophosphatase YjhB (NUDIX family)